MTARGLIELLRRLALAGGCATGAALFFLSGFAPYVTVHPGAGETARSAPGEPAAASQPLIDPRDRRKPAATTQLRVEGAAWQALFAQVQASFAANLPVAGWEERISARELAEARRENPRRAAFTEADRREEAERVARLKAQYGMDVSFTGSFKRLHFFAAEVPFREIAGQLVAYRDTLLTCADCPGTPVLTVVLNPAPKITGFFDVITVPEHFAFPQRALAGWAPLAALVLYLLLPWGRVPADTLAYARWRIALGDFGGLLLFAGPVFLSFAIVGGTVEALRGYPWLVALFWGLAALGLLTLGWNAWAAAYRLQIAEDRLRVTTALHTRELPYAELVAADPVILRPPRWLIMLSWLAVFLGGSRAARLGQTGRSLLLASSGANGLRLTDRQGRRTWIWYSDQLGQTALPGFERLMQGLQAAGVPMKTEPLTLRAVFPPSG